MRSVCLRFRSIFRMISSELFNGRGLLWMIFRTFLLGLSHISLRLTVLSLLSGSRCGEGRELLSTMTASLRLPCEYSTKCGDSQLVFVLLKTRSYSCWVTRGNDIRWLTVIAMSKLFLRGIILPILWRTVAIFHSDTSSARRRVFGLSLTPLR
jgi:hypothetical protein